MSRARPSRAAYYRELRNTCRAKGICTTCRRRPTSDGRKTCSPCSARSLVHSYSPANRLRVIKHLRTPKGWANQKAGVHRDRVRKHNASHPDFLLLEKIIDGPALLAHIIAHGPTCGLCGTHTGFPWEHVGKESGPDVDHILSMWACIHDGRQDWASVSNVRLLCVGCHRIDGVRLKRQDLENHTAMLQALDKDQT